MTFPDAAPPDAWDATVVPPATAQVSVERRGAAVVLRVSGDIDLTTAPGLENTVVTALTEDPRVLVIDLGNVDFLGSVGLSLLVHAHQQAGEHTQLRVVAGTRTTYRPIELSGLHDLLDTYPTLRQALDAADTPPRTND